MNKEDIENNEHEIFTKHNLFGCLKAEDINRILEFANKRNFSDGQTIFQKGEDGNFMMLVLKGEVNITATNIEGPGTYHQYHQTRPNFWGNGTFGWQKKISRCLRGG